MKVISALFGLCLPVTLLLACGGAGTTKVTSPPDGGKATDAQAGDPTPGASDKFSGPKPPEAALVGSVTSGPALDDLPPPPPTRVEHAKLDLTNLLSPPRLVVDGHGHTSRVTSLHYTSDGRTLVSASYDKTVRIWSAQTGRLLRTLRGERGDGAAGRIHASALSPDDKWLAVGGWLGTDPNPPIGSSSPAFHIRLLDMTSGDTGRVFAGHSDVVLSLAFSHDGTRVLSGAGDHQAIIWDAQGGRALLTLYGHHEGVTAVAWSPDDSLVATASADGTARVFDAHSGAEIAVFSGHKGGVQDVTFTPSGRSLLTGGHDGDVRIWEAKSGKLMKTLAKVSAPVGSLAIAPSGLEVMITTAAIPFATHIYNINNGKRVAVHTGHDNVVLASAISPNGKWGATAGGGDFSVSVFGLKSGQVEVKSASHGSTVWNVGFQDDGASIAWGHAFEKAQMGPYQINGPLSYKLPLASLSDPFFVSGLTTNQLQFVRANERAAGVELRTENGREHSVLEIWSEGGRRASIRRDEESGFVHRAFSLSPDGTVVVSGGDNGVLASFESATGRKLHDFEGHTGDVLALAVSPDGSRVVSGSSDQSVRLWDLPTGQLLLTVFHARNGEWVAYTEAGYYAASSFGDAYLGWHAGRGPNYAAAFIPASALSNQLHFEGVVRRHVLLGGEIQVAIDACNKALLAGQPPIRYYRFEDLPQFAPPDIYYFDPGSDLRTESDRLEVTARAHSPNALGIESIRFLVNGRPIDERWMRFVGRPRVTLRGREAEISAVLPLPLKDNRITVVAGNQFNESSPLSFDVERTGGPQELERIYKPDLYLLSVGISDYGSPHLAPLSYAHLDASAVAESLEKHNKTIFRSIDASVLTEKRASRSNILAQLQSIANKAEQKDLAIVFLSGYAKSDSDGRYYFVPHDADTKRLAETAVPLLDLKKALLSLPSRVILVLDSSHAGVLSQAVERTSVDMSGLLRATLTEENDVVVLTSSSGSEASYESDQFKKGVFTHALLEGLSGLADYDRDRFVFVRELELYLSRRVPQLTSGRQHPTTFVPGSLPNFPIAQR
jgi:WD40 repeat protein